MTQVDYSGFYYRPDRVHEFVEEAMDELRAQYPDLENLDVRIHRSLFGTYCTKVSARLFREDLEVTRQGPDPFDGFERCLEQLREDVEARRAVSALERVRLSVQECAAPL